MKKITALTNYNKNRIYAKRANETEKNILKNEL
jgi:hypothetical protein